MPFRAIFAYTKLNGRKFGKLATAASELLTLFV
jgi:hypothetical protein